jgi:hypothetical protein
MTAISMGPLLDRSEALEQALLASFPKSTVLLAVSSTKHELAAAACKLCIEHAHVLRAAFAVGAPSSGTALLRLQYEALLRGAWLIFAATPEQVGTLTTALDLEAEQAAKKLPGYLDMLNALLKAAPEGLTAPLAEFNQYSRHALNSFVHSGIHPLHRTRQGYPMEMSLIVVRFSNALLHFGYRLLATLSGSQRRIDRVTRTHMEFSDCFPRKPATS